MTEQNKDKEKENTTILVVENKTSKRFNIIGMLKNLGFKHFHQAPDGIAAFRLLKRRSVSYIFSSLNMPNMNGMALLKIISADEALHQIPLILIAPTMHKQMVIEAGQYGVAEIILEPVQEDILEKKLEQVMGGEDEHEEKMEGLFEKAVELTEKGKFNEALVAYKDIIKHNETAEIYFNIGYLKTAQGKYDEALVAFRKSVKINNMNARAYKMMGEVFLKLGKTEEAEHQFAKAGEIFLERNMDQEAEEAFNEVIKINPETNNIYNSLGILYRKRGDALGAVRSYKKALKVDPEDENVLYNIGRAQLEANLVADAKESFQSALKLNPDFEEAKRMLHAIETSYEGLSKK